MASEESNRSKQLTENDKRALALIEAAGGRLVTYPSCIGEALYPEPKNRVSRYDNRKRQGLALCGGKAMSRLAKLKLITIRPVFGRGETEYALIRKSGK